MTRADERVDLGLVEVEKVAAGNNFPMCLGQPGEPAHQLGAPLS